MLRARCPEFTTLLMLVLAGCGGDGFTIVPVSGTVRLDGEPLADARVSFQPTTTSTKSVPGRGSMATTDANGRYELKLPDGTPGAVTGPHVVRITTLRQEETENGIETIAEERVPERYNVDTELEREVFAKGNDAVDFDLTTKPAE